jgi:hypothetical protein
MCADFFWKVDSLERELRELVAWDVALQHNGEFGTLDYFVALKFLPWSLQIFFLIHGKKDVK